MESNMELQILHAIQGIHQEWLTEILRFFTTMGESGLVSIVIAIVLTCIPKTRKCGLTMMIAMAVTYLVGNLFLKNVIARPRPCAVDTGVTLKIPFPSEYSFPSGHTSNGFAGAVTIFSYYRKAGILSLLVAAIIAFSRFLRALSHGHSGWHGTGNIGCSTGSLHSKTFGRPSGCEDHIRQR